MKVNVVYAHPVADSYQASLHQRLVQTLKARGDEVVDFDLYEMKFNPADEKQIANSPSAVERRSRPEGRPEPTRGGNSQVKLGTAPPVAPSQPAGPPVGVQPQRPVMSPKEQPRTAERGEANGKSKAAKDHKKKGGEEETAPPAVGPQRQPR